MPLTDACQFVQAAWIIDQRIRFHTGEGQLAGGLTYFPEGRVRIETRDSLPSLSWRNVSVVNEGFRPGAPDPSQAALDKKNALTGYTQLIRFELATPSEFGFLRIEPNDPTQREGHMEWLAMVFDAIETAIDGTVDSGLNGTSYLPVLVNATPDESTDLSIISIVEVTVSLKTYCRGQNRALTPSI